MLPVTESLVNHLGNILPSPVFNPDTHLVAMPHFLPDTLDFMEALIALGMQPGNIHLLGKQDSLVYGIQDTLKAMNIDVMEQREPLLGNYKAFLEQEVIPAFYRHVSSRLDTKRTPQTMILLDNGGTLRRNFPHAFAANPNLQKVGVEVVTEGIAAQKRIMPVVLPAASALKRVFEPILIARGAIAKVQEQLHAATENTPCAVIGSGLIGGRLIEALAQEKRDVFVYDKSPDLLRLLPKDCDIYRIPDNGTAEAATLMRQGTHASGRIYVCESLESAVRRADNIFGCTGKDIFADEDIDRFDFGTSPKRFMSVSLGDVEFSSLLQWMAQQQATFTHPTSYRSEKPDVTFSDGLKDITVARRGFPVNFDGREGSGSVEEMQLITGFLTGSVVQASQFAKTGNIPPETFMFSPELQYFIMEKWLEKVPDVSTFYSPDILREIRENPQHWLASHSGGQYCGGLNSGPDVFPTRAR